MKGTGVDVIGLDWTVDMADGRKRLGSGISVQGNVDPAYLFSPLPTLTEEIQRLVMERFLNSDLPYYELQLFWIINRESPNLDYWISLTTYSGTKS